MVFARLVRALARHAPDLAREEASAALARQIAQQSRGFTTGFAGQRVFVAQRIGQPVFFRQRLRSGESGAEIALNLVETHGIGQ